MRQKISCLTLLCLLIANLAYSAELTESFVSEPVFGTRVRIVEAGADKPLSLILLHGVGQEGAAIWDELIPELAQHYHLVACDLPGFGKSDKPNVLYSPERFSQFISWLVEQTVSERFILVGHSLGGALALHYAASAEVKPDKLILIDVAGILHRAALTKFLLHLKITKDKSYVPSAPLSWLSRLTGTMVEKLQGLPVDLDLMLRSSLLREKILNSDPNKIAGLALIQTDFTSLINKVETPTILIWGENDDIAPLRTGRLLAARLPQAQLDIIPDGGHTPMRQQPEAFRQVFWRALLNPPVQLPPHNYAATERIGSCLDQKEAHFSGYYRRIELLRCQNVQLVDVTTEALLVTESEITIERSQIKGGSIGLQAVRSKIFATALAIEADLPIQTDQSSFDFAGVTLKSRGKQLVVGRGNPSRLLFSVSRGIGPQRNDNLHKVVKITKEQPL